MVVANQTVELLVIVWWESWVWQSNLPQCMISVDDLMKQTVSKAGVAPGKVEGFFSAHGHPWKLFS